MLLKFLAKYRDCGLLMLRLYFGIAYMIHGLPKVVAGPKTWHAIGAGVSHIDLHFWATVFGFLVAVTEGIGGLLLILGVFYRPICLFLTVAMLALAHGAWTSDPFSKGFSHPLMAVVFFALALVGPGRFSIDKD